MPKQPGCVGRSPERRQTRAHGTRWSAGCGSEGECGANNRVRSVCVAHRRAQEHTHAIVCRLQPTREDPGSIPITLGQEGPFSRLLLIKGRSWHVVRFTRRLPELTPGASRFRLRGGRGQPLLFQRCGGGCGVALPGSHPHRRDPILWCSSFVPRAVARGRGANHVCARCGAE